MEDINCRHVCRLFWDDAVQSHSVTHQKVSITLVKYSDLRTYDKYPCRERISV